MALEKELALDLNIKQDDLDLLMKKLMANKKLSTSTINQIELHASLLGRRICESFTELNGILLRYESLIRKRWTKKSTAQRRDFLLTIHPNMPRKYRPDDIWCLMPYINLENLTKAKPLLVFMNARGRNLPWTFAATEKRFCSLAQMVPPCKDENLCRANTVMFTKDPDPNTYGKMNKQRDRTEEHRVTNDYFEACARTSVQVLHIQDTILRFLETCAKTILHDVLTDNVVIDQPIQEEPPLHVILNDGSSSGHISFSNVLMIAPYRGSHSLDLDRLFGSIAATADFYREHVLQLHEDPSYFADTLKEYEEHAPHELHCCSEHTYTSLQRDSNTYRVKILRRVLTEALYMRGSWELLEQQLFKLGKTLRKGLDMRGQIHALGEVKYHAQTMYRELATKIGRVYSAAPNIRKVMRTYKKEGTIGFALKQSLTPAQHEMLHLLSHYNTCEAPDVNRPETMSWSMETLDVLIRSNEECSALVSESLLSLLSDASVLTECIRQIALWELSPHVRAHNHEHDHKDKYTYKDECTCDGQFAKLAEKIQRDTLPLHHIYPYKDKLYYPAHKRRNRETVEAMRRAEANLDKFWDTLYTVDPSSTRGFTRSSLSHHVPQVEELQRTAPWVERMAHQPRSNTEIDYEYMPLSHMVHDKAMQITGAFDRLAMNEEKAKPKTRGPVITDDAGTNSEEALVVPDTPPQRKLMTNHPFVVDQRTYKVFKTMFFTPVSSVGDLPKAIKWAEFKRAMVHIGFTAEKLQGSAWQFIPGHGSNGAERNIQFHEPHPDSDVPYVMAKRFGRRLGRVYGWSTESFKLA
ncbi:hypothetical protein ACEQ8H_000382 [Pleosporales sp. CAS-2024a]